MTQLVLWSPHSPLPSPREQWFIVVWILSTQSCSNQNSLRKTWPGFFSQIQTSSFYKNKQVLFIFTNMFLLQTFDVSYVPPVQFPIQNEDVSKCIKACNVAHVWLLPSLINLIQLNPTFMPMSTNATRESEGSKDCRKLQRDKIKDQSFIEKLKRYGCEMCG